VMLNTHLSLVHIIKEYRGCTSTRLPRVRGGVKAINMNITVFWDVTPCSFVDWYIECHIPKYRKLHFMISSALILLLLSC